MLMNKCLFYRGVIMKDFIQRLKKTIKKVKEFVYRKILESIIIK